MRSKEILGCINKGSNFSIVYNDSQLVTWYILLVLIIIT